MSEVVTLAIQAIERELTKRLQEMANIAAATQPTASPDFIAERCTTALDYFKKPLEELARWLVTSNENTNFTYPLSTRGEQYMASAISLITKTPVERVEGYINELAGDNELAKHIADKSQYSPNADGLPHYGRRVGWYCFTRILKPRLVVETGVDKGLGAAVIASALLRNSTEGTPGKYLGTDINPAAGHLFSGKYKETGEIAYGDSITSLKKLREPIDLFINDSDHSEEYEYREYQTILANITTRSVILGDNAHCTSKLRTFCREVGRQFIFIPELPGKHWYPGAGIGVAFINEPC